jgi:hypothetical protein
MNHTDSTIQSDNRETEFEGLARAWVFGCMRAYEKITKRPDTSASKPSSRAGENSRDRLDIPAMSSNL